MKNVRGYAATGVLVEKYDVEQGAGQSGGRGGEYPLQVGLDGPTGCWRS